MNKTELDAFRLVASVLLCLTAGFIGSYYTTQSIPTWYAGLEKPSFNPPNWVFGPVWTMLYVMMGVSLYIFWKKNNGFGENRLGLILFAIQLVLNSLWSIIFFGWRDISLALAEIMVLWAVILATIILFKKTSRTASLLLTPYLLWVSFATILNYSIMTLNP
ncbi:MAG: TspO/MBR family protein [Candidatus Altiarchaeota archaeon]